MSTCSYSFHHHLLVSTYYYYIMSLRYFSLRDRPYQHHYYLKINKTTWHQSQFPDLSALSFSGPICKSSHVQKDCAGFLFTNSHWWFLLLFLISLMYKALFTLSPLLEPFVNHRASDLDCHKYQPFKYVFLYQKLTSQHIDMLSPENFSLSYCFSFIHSHRKYLHSLRYQALWYMLGI